MADPRMEKTEVLAGGDPRLQPRIGRYRLERRLGAGGMAEVFLAKSESDAGPHGKFEKQVVIKRIRPALVAQERFVEMFLREARLLAGLDHPNIVRIIELDVDRGEYFLALEYLEGLSLRELAERHWAALRPLPIETLLGIVGEAALGLEHAHKYRDAAGTPANIIHRDVSPDNLFVTATGTTKVIDFGIAKKLGSDQLTQAGELKGKVPFMSPEHLQGLPLDARADLFSMGVVLYWLFTGRRPFDGNTDMHTMKAILEDEPRPPRAWNPKLPVPLAEIVMSLLEKDRNKRIQSAGGLHDALMTLTVGLRGAPGAGDLVSAALGLPGSEHEVVPAGLAAMPVLVWPAAGDPPPSAQAERTQAGMRIGAVPVTENLGLAVPSSDFAPSTEITNVIAVDVSTDEHKRASGGSSVVPSDPVIDVSRVVASAEIEAQPTQLSLKPRSVSLASSDDAPPTTPSIPRVVPQAVPIELPSITDAPALNDSGDAIRSFDVISSASDGAGRLFDPPPDVLATTELPPVAIGPPRRAAVPVVTGVATSLVVVTLGLWLAGVLPGQRSTAHLDDDAGTLASVPVPVLYADAGAVAEVDAGVVAVVSADAGSAVVEGEGELDVDAGGVSGPRPTGPSHRAPALIVTLVGPSTVVWLGEHGENLGAGNKTVKLTPGAHALTAFDQKRGAKTKVTVDARNNHVDYGKLPRQQLQVRARPFAEVFLGHERLGITPLAPVEVVAGTYDIRFVYKKVTRMEHVDVSAKAPATVNVVMAKTATP